MESHPSFPRRIEIVGDPPSGRARHTPVIHLVAAASQTAPASRRRPCEVSAAFPAPRPSRQTSVSTPNYHRAAGAQPSRAALLQTGVEHDQFPHAQPRPRRIPRSMPRRRTRAVIPVFAASSSPPAWRGRGQHQGGWQVVAMGPSPGRETISAQTRAGESQGAVFRQRGDGRSRRQFRRDNSLVIRREPRNSASGMGCVLTETTSVAVMVCPGCMSP